MRNRRPPAESDMQRFFSVTPSSVHQIVMALAAQGLVQRIPGRARSLHVLVPTEALPALKEPSHDVEE